MRGYKSVLYNHFLFLIDVIARLVVVKRGFTCFEFFLEMDYFENSGLKEIQSSIILENFG